MARADYGEPRGRAAGHGRQDGGGGDADRGVRRHGAAVATIAIDGDDAVVYSGPAEWSFRRMVLHQAWLAKAAGGVDAFVIGTGVARSDAGAVAAPATIRSWRR